MRKDFFKDYAIPETDARHFYDLYIGWNPTYEQFISTAKQTNFIEKTPIEVVKNIGVKFWSVKEFCDFWFAMLGIAAFPKDILKAQELGYICRSLAEEAEEMYLNYKTNKSIAHVIPTGDIIDKQHEAIQYLKKQLGEKC